MQNIYHMKKSNKLYILLSSALLLLTSGCTKFSDVPPASNIMNAQAVFSTDGGVSNAIAGMYVNAYMTSLNVFQSNIALCPGLSADELIYTGTNTTYEPFYRNQLAPNNGAVQELWTAFYKSIYLANTMIEGVDANEKVLTPAVASTAKGEGLFMRAFCHFYLTNLFGDVPLVLTSDPYKNNVLPREQQAKVYEQIIADLKAAKELLQPDYSASATRQRFRANKFAASALLARVYLYTGQWALAASEASAVIGAKDLYKLMPSADIAKVFYKNSPETIWQMNGSTGASSTFNGYNALAFSFVDYVPLLALTDAMENSFSPDDLRFQNWTVSAEDDNKTYRVPFKYRNLYTNTTTTAEGYTYLRLAEQFLIRAEAKAQLGVDFTGAKADLDTVRTRAGLPKSTAAGKADLLLAIENERKLELFAEVGHRWFDLKRTGRAAAILGAKPDWQHYKMLYPVPVVEIFNNGNLKQNEGYAK
jgi:starch-binding outer membrane protein, SusD/RagB family